MTVWKRSILKGDQHAIIKKDKKTTRDLKVSKRKEVVNCRMLQKGKEEKAKVCIDFGSWKAPHTSIKAFPYG